MYIPHKDLLIKAKHHYNSMDCTSNYELILYPQHFL